MTPSTANINLASQPFRNERLQNAAWGLVCLCLALVALVLTSIFLRERSQAAALRSEIDRQRSVLARLERDGAQFSAVLAKPVNADVFSRSVFLNEVIARRAVSWTLVFRDLERLLPPNVKLIGVRLPQVSGEQDTAALARGTNRVQLDMLVGMDRAETVTELLKRLSASKLFGAARILAQQPPNQNDPLYKYRVTVPYAQEL